MPGQKAQKGYASFTTPCSKRGAGRGQLAVERQVQNPQLSRSPCRVQGQNPADEQLLARAAGLGSLLLPAGTTENLSFPHGKPQLLSACPL